MKVHVIETGRIVVSEVLARGENQWRAVFKALLDPQPLEIPIHAYVIEHPDGLVVVDTGLHAEARLPRALRRLIRLCPMDPTHEVGPQMQAQGLRPQDVRWVIPTHLHLDHAGGVRRFPDAEILVHRPEYDQSKRFLGRWQYQPHVWPEWFRPTVYDLDPKPYHSFPDSLALASDIKLVPIPGHSVGQVAVVVESAGPTLFFSGDHTMRQDWFFEDIAAGRLVMLGFDSKTSRETSRRIASFAREVPTMLIPAHDATVAERLSDREPVSL